MKYTTSFYTIFTKKADFVEYLDADNIITAIKTEFGGWSLNELFRLKSFINKNN